MKPIQVVKVVKDQEMCINMTVYCTPMVYRELVIRKNDNTTTLTTSITIYEDEQTMNEFEIVKHIMMLNRVSYDDFSDRLGYKSKSSSYQILNKKHIYVDTWRRFLKELGYEIVVRKRGGTEGIVVTDDDFPSPLRFHGMNLNLDDILSDKEE